MTSTQASNMLTNAEDFARRLVLDARSDVKVKLKAVDAACQSILESGGTVTINSVRSWLATNTGIQVAYSTLVNSRTDNNTGEKIKYPARQIIDKYKEVQEFKISGVRKKQAHRNFSTPDFSEAELLSIEDHQVRYKVQLLSARVRNLNKQLNAVREIRNLPLVSTSMLSQNLLKKDADGSALAVEGTDLTIDEQELDALADFLKPGALKRRQMKFDDDGILQIESPPSRKRTTIQGSRGFFEQALRKILISYGRG